MKVVYLPANQRYAVRHGDSIISIGAPAQTLFASKRELKAALHRCGLKMNQRGEICRAKEKEGTQ